MLRAGSILELNAELNKFSYGCIYGSFPYYYRSVEPRVFEKMKKGVCWDFVAYQKYFFDKKFPDIRYKIYYLESDFGQTCHSFMIYETGLGRFGSFESCHDPKGVRLFESSEEAIDYVVNNFVKKKNQAYILFEYEPPDRYELPVDDYMKYIYRNGKRIRDINGYREIISGL
jgi:hypothetical protein